MTLYSGNAPLLAAGALINQRLDLDLLFKYAYDTKYSEITYDTLLNVKIVDVWEDNSKQLKLFTKTLTFNTNGTASSVVIVDEETGASKTKTITYNPDETIATITETFSE